MAPGESGARARATTRNHRGRRQAASEVNASPPPVCEVALEFPVFDQYDGKDKSACGTTGLAQILAYWNPSRP